jgi:prepilin-type N-terminal cleavage/methylation domain-containing protein
MENQEKARNGASGFSLIEVLMAIVILGGGLLALATGLAQGMMTVSASHYHQIAKEQAVEAMESIFTARDARKIESWDLIRNTSDEGIFLTGFQPILTPGADGLVNTADDGDPEEYKDSGRDGILGTSDDKTVSLANFTREIQINDIGSNKREIQVIVRYRIGALDREYRLVSCITPFS